VKAMTGITLCLPSLFSTHVFFSRNYWTWTSFLVRLLLLYL